MLAHFDGRLRELKKEAQIDARRTITAKGDIEYDVLTQGGDATVRKQLIARFMSGEVENALKDNSNVAINTLNYRFKYRGSKAVGTQEVQVYELHPRAKAEGLFKGELWLDTQTGLPLKESGKLVKSPSVFLKDVQFSRSYEIREGIAMPVLIQTSTMVRVYGLAELDVRYTDFAWKRTTGAATAKP